jgi:hypothetical protein
MSFRLAPCVTALVLNSLAVSLVACGGDGESADTTTDADGSDGSFACFYDDLFCDPAADEICVYQEYANGGGPHSGACVVAPACADCDCAMDAAVASFDGGNNCDGGVACDQDNDQLTVVCQNVPF